MFENVFVVIGAFLIKPIFGFQLWDGAEKLFLVALDVGDVSFRKDDFEDFVFHF